MTDNAAGATATHQVDHGGLAGHGADSRVRRGNPLPTRRSCVSLVEPSATFPFGIEKNSDLHTIKANGTNVNTIYGEAQHTVAIAACACRGTAPRNETRKSQNVTGTSYEDMRHCVHAMADTHLRSASARREAGARGGSGARAMIRCLGPACGASSWVVSQAGSGCGAGTVCPLRRSGRTARTTRVAAPRRAAATTAHSAEPQAKCRTPAATRPPVEPSTVEPSGSQRNVALSPALLWTLPPRLHCHLSCPLCSVVRLSCEHGDTDP